MITISRFDHAAPVLQELSDHYGGCEEFIIVGDIHATDPSYVDDFLRIVKSIDPDLGKGTVHQIVGGDGLYINVYITRA